MSPIQINTTQSNSFVRFSAQIPSTTTKVYGPAISWDNFVDHQPEWVKSLLKNIHFFTDNGELNMESIWIDLRKFGYLLIVSDGSVCYIYIMSFSYILLNLKVDWLVATSGLSMGRSSLCIEGDGKLSGALFL